MLSPTTGQAVRALAFLASQLDGTVAVADVARHTGLPTPTVGKVIHRLARQRLVATRRGPGGGVRLARPAREISLHDVCIAFGDPLTAERCMLSDAPCSSERACPGHAFCRNFRSTQVLFLRQTTLADVVCSASPGPIITGDRAAA
ncbi:MAG: Rrf2 family transcriptional regulator [Trueperaceae bacterium]|nr:Rrf2 family transcriptional regulator [Trueperaceae bacterium]